MSNEKTKAGLFSRFAQSAKSFLSDHSVTPQQLNEAENMSMSSATSIASLLGSGRRQARHRQAIYEKWSFMEGDAIVSSALSLQVTSALGGHETTGDTVFIEKTPLGESNARLGEIAEEIAKDLTPIFNRIAFTSAYNGAAFGDSYGRVYSEQGVGVIEVLCDEMVHPTLVQAYEKGSKTIGFSVYTGQKASERLSVTQMARLKMPRTVWIPQPSVIEKSVRVALTEDDLSAQPILPALVGGSFLYQCEESYDNLYASLLGMVGQRWMDSIDEQIITLNMDSMTKVQQDRFAENVVKMFKSSKARAEQAVKSGRPIMERIRHILPIFNDKQMLNVQSAPNGASGRGGTIAIEDVMLHARLLAGALGTDLSMVGFADLLSGGLGDGGFFRTSAQSAERARVIRTALADFFYSIVDIHTLHRYGIVFNESERPFKFNFYGSISALEAEKARTKTEAMSSASLLVQSLQMLKDLHVPKEVMESILSKLFLLDEDQAKLYSQIADIKSDDEGDAGGGFGGH